MHLGNINQISEAPGLNAETRAKSSLQRGRLSSALGRVVIINTIRTAVRLYVQARHALGTFNHYLHIAGSAMCGLVHGSFH